jgi:hypothetical protein
MCGLAILDEVAVKVDLSDCAGPNSSNFLGYGLSVVDVHMG